MSTNKIHIISFFLALVLIFPGIAFAYLDPGTGSMIIQGVLAAIAAVVVSAGIFWKKLKTIFGGPKEQGEKREKDET